MYTVKTYDTSGQLICWFTTNNKAEAERYASSLIEGAKHDYHDRRTAS